MKRDSLLPEQKQQVASHGFTRSPHQLSSIPFFHWSGAWRQLTASSAVQAKYARPQPRWACCASSCSATKRTLTWSGAEVRQGQRGEVRGLVIEEAVHKRSSTCVPRAGELTGPNPEHLPHTHICCWE